MHLASKGQTLIEKPLKAPRRKNVPSEGGLNCERCNSAPSLQIDTSICVMVSEMTSYCIILCGTAPNHHLHCPPATSQPSPPHHHHHPTPDIPFQWHTRRTDLQAAPSNCHTRQLRHSWSLGKKELRSSLATLVLHQSREDLYTRLLRGQWACELMSP